jgi:hypothetical protein
MKKFTENDLFVNTIKTYPTVRFFIYSGSVVYNDTADRGAKLFDFLNEPQVIITVPILLFAESFEYPSWFGTYDTGSIVVPTFTGSVTFLETFESGSWPGP